MSEVIHQKIYKHVYRAVANMLPQQVVTGELWLATEDAAKEIENDAVEAAIMRIEAMGGNDLYKQAYRKVVRMLRKQDFNKPSQILNDTQEQISSVIYNAGQITSPGVKAGARPNDKS